jgi:hypothetical protein
MSDEEPARTPARSWRGRVPAPFRRGIAILLTLLVVEYLIVPKFVAAKDNVSLIVHADFVLFVVAVLLEAVSLFAYALLTRVLLPPGSPGVGTLFRVDLAATAIAHVIPGGSAASAALGYRLFTRLGIDGGAAGFAMATQGLGSAVVLNVLLWIALVISIPFAGVHAIYATVAVVGMLAMLAVAGLVLAFTWGEESAIHVVRVIGRHLPRLTEGRVESIVRQISDSLRALWHNRGQFRLAIVWAALNWLFDAACLWAFLAAFHRYVNPIELFAAYGIGNVLAAIPITPGGLGVVEATTIPPEKFRRSRRCRARGSHWLAAHQFLAANPGRRGLLRLASSCARRGAAELTSPVEQWCRQFGYTRPKYDESAMIIRPPCDERLVRGTRRYAAQPRSLAGTGFSEKDGGANDVVQRPAPVSLLFCGIWRSSVSPAHR